MRTGFKEEFLVKWKKYFGKSELPFVFFYAPERGDIPLARPPRDWSCLICELAKVRQGESLAYHKDNLRCGGARRYLGYEQGIRKNFEYFLSCGIPGEMEGERYLRTPEMVKEMMGKMPPLDMNDQFVIFKRWDKLEESDEPVGIIFFATPEVLSGLFTLANVDRVDGKGVTCQFGSGCGSIVYQVIREAEKEDPRAVIGMFDPSARPCVPRDILSFSLPMKKFGKMVGYMDESFLITGTWKEIRRNL